MPEEDRVMATNYSNLGNLVKSWVLGEDRVNFGRPPPLPKSLEELKNQCLRADVGLLVPDSVKALQFIQANDETLLIRLPSATKLRASEAKIKADPQNYPLLKFYRDRYAGAAPRVVNVEDALDLQAARIGDYTIAQCG
jgi:hypothetical protein